MKVTKKERIVLRVLGYRCCVTCEFFDSQTNTCNFEKRWLLENIFDLRKNRELRLRKKTRIERLALIGSACPYWRGFKLEGGDMK